MVYKPALKNNFAFTLIELLIAVSVMLILTAVTIMLLNPTKLRSNANETKSLSELGTVTNALEFYYNDKHSYPTDINDSTNGLVAQEYLTDEDLLKDEAGDSYCYLTRGDTPSSYKICTKSNKENANTVLLERQNLTKSTSDDYTRAACPSGTYPDDQKVQCLQSPF